MAKLTQRAERRLLDGRQTAVVDRQMPDVQRQEHEALQLGQVVVAQLQIEDDRILALEGAHGPRNVLHVRGLTQNVQPVLLDLALARINVRHRWTRLRWPSLTGGQRGHRDQHQPCRDHREPRGA